jgi:subtilisin family serine protease
VTVVYAFRFQDKVLIAYDGGEETRDGVMRDSLVVNFRKSVPVKGALFDVKAWGFHAPFKGHGFSAIAPVGSGVRVGILDTGIDCDHPDLVTGGIYGTGCGNSRTMVPGDPYSPYEDPFNPPFGHGTAVAGVIVAQNNGSVLEGVASEGWFNSYRVFAADGSFSCHWAAAAVEQAMVDGMDVLNLSLGLRDTLPNRIECTELETAINTAYGYGVLVVAAAGNLALVGPDVAIPAVYEGAMAVSGVACDAVFYVGVNYCTTNAYFWDGSSRGPEVDIAAAAHYLPGLNSGGGYRWVAGTSFAAPMVSAAAMALISTYEDTRYQAHVIRWWLKEHAYGPSGHWGDPNLYGAGILDAGGAVAAGNPCEVVECYIHPLPW